MAEPTPEQQAAIEAFADGGTIVLEAGAGTGKTTTLKLLAAKRPSERGIYLAYNRAIAESAKKTFPKNVSCSTAHSLAYRAVGYQYKSRLDAPLMPSYKIAGILDIAENFSSGRLSLEPFQLARIAMNTVNFFCKSTDVEISAIHVPFPDAFDDPIDQTALASFIVPYALVAWEDLQRPDGRLKFDHDHYLKMWQLSKPRIAGGFILFDEAQDADPVIADVVSQQTHTQRVYVGDAAQAIYGWRGAVDAMSKIQNAHRLRLTQSFRFGPPIADEANKWLAILGSDFDLKGLPSIRSNLVTLSNPDAVLCRSNAGCFNELFDALTAGIPTALAGGAGELKALARAALSLSQGKRSEHRAFAGFRSWDELCDYVETDHPGQQLRTLVKLVNEHGAQTLLQALDRTVDERSGKAVRTISTAHKAKGLEWQRVRIATDYFEPFERRGVMDPVAPEEAMLAYVAVTRARNLLDPEGLSWIDKYLLHHPPRNIASRFGSVEHDFHFPRTERPAPRQEPTKTVPPAPVTPRLPVRPGAEPPRRPTPTPPPPAKPSWWRRLLGLS